jgi:death-on-curing protein
LSDDIIYLIEQEIIDVHDFLLAKYDGIPGIKEPGMINYMTEKPMMELDGQELYPGLFMKAAVYMEGFAAHQYFNDGNKRTAVGCVELFLAHNGYELLCSQDELYNFTMAVAEKRIVELSQIARWIERNSD